MTRFENIVIGENAILSLSITIVLMIALTVVFFLYWRRKNRQQTNISWLIAGALGFIVSARVFELAIHYVCIISDNPISRCINGNTATYVLYGITMAGVFEEVGRYLVLKFIMKKNRTRENAVLYGIGHGGIEVLVVIVPAMISYLAIAVIFSSGDVENALSSLKITEETAAAAWPSVQMAASFDYGMMVLNVIERLLAMILHIGCTIIVYYSVLNKKSKYLLIAILLHMLMDTFPALYQKGVVPLWAVEVWAAFWAAAVLFIASRRYREMKKMSLQ